MDKIAKLLYEDARLTAADIAVMTGCTEAEAAQKIKQLEDEGVICGYKAVVNWDKLDEEKVSALIEIKVTPKADAGFDEIAKEIMGYEEVESIYLMSGGFDLAVLISERTFKEVATFVARRLATLDSVLSTATHFILNRYKDMGVVLCEKQTDDRGTISA